MDYFAITRTLEDKLASTLDKNSLLHTMDRSKYPITLTITQNKAPDAQMQIFAESEGGVSSQDSVLRFVFKLEGLEVHTNSRLIIGEALMNKLKNQAKKIHAAYVHAFFAATANRGLADLPELLGDESETEAVNDTQDPGAFDAFYVDDEDGEDDEDIPLAGEPDEDEE